MKSCIVLLLALVASSAAAAAAEGGFYSKVASCVAREIKNEAGGMLSSAVGIAQAGPPPEKAVFGMYYSVAFTPGMGCFLSSVMSVPPQGNVTIQQVDGTSEPTIAQFGAIIATSARASANAKSFTCTFTRSSASVTAAQARNLAQYSPLKFVASNYADAFKLPAKLSSLKDKLRCSYVLYAKTGYNYTQGQDCTATGNPEDPYNCTGPAPAFDAPSIQWHFDKDNQPASSNVTDASITVTCKVNTSLVNNVDTLLLRPLPNDACFPASARVMTPGGPKPMAQLAVGDKVLAIDAATGQPKFDDVYLVPHRDADATATYLNIHASPIGAQGSGKVLTLSPMHYVPTACGADQQQQCLKHAREVASGDLVWLVEEGQQALLARVDMVTISTEQGLYSPWTLSGSIVVEGFAASTHTAWPLEAQLLQLLPRKHAMSAQHGLAQAHHAVQAPLRAVYRALGKSPLALLDSVISALMEAGKASNGGLAAAVRAAAQTASTAM